MSWGERELHVFSLHGYPDQDDRIYDSLINDTSMTAVQAEDEHDSFLLAGDLKTIIRSVWVLRPRIVMELQPLSCVAAFDLSP